MSLYCKETAINQSEGHMIYESKVEEAYFDTVGEAYRYGISEHGRCEGRVYFDKDGKTIHNGWVFLKKVKYEDCDESYLHETWLCLYEKPSETVVTEFPLDIGKRGL